MMLLVSLSSLRVILQHAASFNPLLVVVASHFFLTRSVCTVEIHSLTSDQVLHMSFGSSVQTLDLTAWSGLAHNLADLLLLGRFELVFVHFQSLKPSLPGKEAKQRVHAIALIYEPLPLFNDSQALQSVELSIGEHLKERSCAMFWKAECLLEMQGAEAAAECDGLRSKLQ